MKFSIKVTRTEETLIDVDAPTLTIAKQKALYQATERRARHPWNTTSLILKDDKSVQMFFEAALGKSKGSQP